MSFSFLHFMHSVRSMLSRFLILFFRSLSLFLRSLIVFFRLLVSILMDASGDPWPGHVHNSTDLLIRKGHVMGIDCVYEVKYVHCTCIAIFGMDNDYAFFLSQDFPGLLYQVSPDEYFGPGLWG